MNFTDLLNECLAMWPDTIDVSDGYFVANGGFFSQQLVSAWEKAKTKTQSKGEWAELMTWILYKCIHENAVENFLNQVYSFTTETVKYQTDKVKVALMENLRQADYEEMLDEYLASNP